MSNFPRLKVVRWGGLIAATHQTIPEVRGHVVDEAMISSNLRRRMGRLERLAARCALGVLKSDHRQGEQTGELIFCSRFGNVETLETLLCSLYLREPVSPMAFSGSVHNAAPGLVGQIRNERLNHTAIASGQRSLAAGLIESASRLVTEPCSNVTLIYAETGLPALFRELDDSVQCDIALGLRLMLAPANDSNSAIRVTDGVEGARQLLDSLESGISQLFVGDAS